MLSEVSNLFEMHNEVMLIHGQEYRIGEVISCMVLLVPARHPSSKR